MFLRHIIPAVLFCFFTFSQVAAPVFCHYLGKIHLFNSGCADDAAVLLFVNDDDGAYGDAVAPLTFDTYLPGGFHAHLSACNSKSQNMYAPTRRPIPPADLRLYVQYRVFRI